MSKRKGVSANEKRSRLLGVYHSSGDVYTLNEIQKEGSKVGIVHSAILDTNQQLVDDGQVETDKIGSTGYYWSFPSKMAQDVARQATQLTDDVSHKQFEIQEAERAITTAQESRSRNPNRAENLQLYNKLTAEISTLEATLSALKENDPVEIAKQQADIDLCKDAANRWTDNISQIISWLVKSKGMTTKEARETLKNMGVATNLEYMP